MNGSNGYSPANYGAPLQQQPQFGASPSQPPAYGASPPQQGAYGAPPPQQAAYGAPPSQGYSPYGAVPQQQYGAPSQPYGAQQPQYPQQQMQRGMNPHATPKSTGLAVALELLGGFFFQTFGVGHLYAGNVGVGLGLMFGYWVLAAINLVLCFAFIGFITWPVTWVAFMVISSITANNAAKRTNAKNMGLAF